ncbi:nuclear transport factor 2 family protein [soil metagenome]
MDNEHIAVKWLQAFNDHDLEALLFLYDENAIHFSPKLKIRMPETDGLIKGKEALRSWWKDAFQRIPELHYQQQTITANHDRVFMEYTRIVPGEVIINVAEVLEINNGKIIASRVYHG